MNILEIVGLITIIIIFLIILGKIILYLKLKYETRKKNIERIKDSIIVSISNLCEKNKINIKNPSAIEKEWIREDTIGYIRNWNIVSFYIYLSEKDDNYIIDIKFKYQTRFMGDYKYSNKFFNIKDINLKDIYHLKNKIERNKKITKLK